MTPTEFMDEVVLPTAREFMAARGDRRRAYLACISAFHLCDYVRRTDDVAIDVVRNTIRSLCQPSFDVINGVCNGSKHSGRTRGNFRHEPGSERVAPRINIGVSAIGRDRIGTAGLEVLHDGRFMFVDACLQAFLIGAAKAYPDHFGSSDLTWIDPSFR